VPRQRLNAITRCGRFRSWGDYSVLFWCRSPSSRPIATGGPPSLGCMGRHNSLSRAAAFWQPLVWPSASWDCSRSAFSKKGWLDRSSAALAALSRDRPRRSSPRECRAPRYCSNRRPPPTWRRRNAQSALRRRDAGMIIEEMRAKALEYTSLYFPDLRWLQPKFQDALAAFFHYILTGPGRPRIMFSNDHWAGRCQESHVHHRSRPRARSR
jgi:hypothetical protein